MNERIGDLVVAKTARVTIGGEFVDLNGHVNYLGYPILFERQRNGLLVSRGMSLESIDRDYGLYCVVGGLQIKYRGSAQEGDEVDLETAGFLRDKLQLTFRQVMRRGSEVIVQYELVNFFRRPGSTRIARIPDKLIEKLSIPEESLPENMRCLEGKETLPRVRE